MGLSFGYVEGASWSLSCGVGAATINFSSPAWRGRSDVGGAHAHDPARDVPERTRRSCSLSTGPSSGSTIRSTSST